MRKPTGPGQVESRCLVSPPGSRRQGWSLFNFDIATGNVSTAQNPSYASEGPVDVYNITNEPVQLGGSQCYVLDRDQCTNDQWKSVMDGTALIKDWIVVDANTSHLFPDLVGNGTATPSGGAAPPESTGGAGRNGVGGALLVALMASLAIVL